MCFLFVAGLLLLGPTTEVLQVVGRDTTVTQGETAVLSCSLIDTRESLTLISWQRQTRRHPQVSYFATITPGDRLTVLNGDGDRVKFIGNFDNKDGSLELSRVTLVDEGNYTCLFTLFNGGIPQQTVTLHVLVPPLSSIVDHRPVLGDQEVSLASCTAAAAKPPASVSWLLADVPGGLTTTNSSIQHDNGTATTTSSLAGVPSREINNQLVQCLVTSPVFKDQTLTFNLHIYSPPTEVNIRQQAADSWKCEAEAHPAATLVWTRTDGPWPQSSVTADGPTLKVVTWTPSLNGLYQCEASNQYGSKYKLLHIHVAPGGCVVCWILFSLSLLLNVVVGMWLLYRSGLVNRIPIIRNWQPVQTKSSSEKRAAREAPEEVVQESDSL